MSSPRVLDKLMCEPVRQLGSRTDRGVVLGVSSCLPFPSSVERPSVVSCSQLRTSITVMRYRGRVTGSCPRNVILFIYFGALRLKCSEEVGPSILSGDSR